MSDRSKYQKTKKADVKQSNSAIEQNRNWAGRIKLKPGKNRIRIYPFHPDKGGRVYAEPIAVYYLPIDVKEKDEKGKETGKIERKNKPVFDAIVHGNGIVKKDIIAEYIKFTESFIKEIYSNNEAKMKNALAPLYPIKGKGGLVKQTSWGCYVNCEFIDAKGNPGKKEFGLFEFKKAVEIGLEKIADSRQDPNDPFNTDPFTDVNDGIAVEITYDDKADKPADYYYVAIAPETKMEGGKKVIATYELTDEELTAFEKVPSLYEIYRNVYNIKHFELALEGLRNFDEENKIGVFENEDWIKIVEDLKLQYKSGSSSDEEEEEEEEENGGDEFDYMDRNELKQFNKDNGCGIIVTTKMTEDDIRNKIREWKIAQEEEVEEEIKEEEEIEEVGKEIEEEEKDFKEKRDLPDDFYDEEKPKVSSIDKFKSRIKSKKK